MTKMTHPQIPNAVIEVGRFGVARHEAQGWQVADDTSVTETGRHEAQETPAPATAQVSLVGVADAIQGAGTKSEPRPDKDPASTSDPESEK